MKLSWPWVLVLGFGSGLLLELTLRLPATNVLAPLVLLGLLLVLARGNAPQGGVAMLLFAVPSGLWVHEGGFLLHSFWSALGFLTYVVGYGLVGVWTVWARQRWGIWAAWLALLSSWAALMWVLMQPQVTERFAHLAWVAIAVALLDTPLLPAAAWSGITGLGLMLWLLNLGLYSLIVERRWTPLVGVLALTGLAVWLAPTVTKTGRVSDFTIAQTNTPYIEEELGQFHLPLANQLLQPLAELSQNSKGVLLWPEASVVTPFEFGKAPQPELLQALANSKEAIIGGTGIGPAGQVYNTALLWSDGRLQAAYNKQVPMPGGEDFLTAGDSSRPVEAGGLKLGVLICYESIIPWVGRNSVQAGAQALVVITSDNFAGGTDTPLAHLAGSRILAAALGRPLVFASKTGPSVFTDVWGRVTGQSQRGAVVALQGSLEGYAGLTPYARFGDWLGILGLGVVLMQLVWMVSRPFEAIRNSAPQGDYVR